MKVQDHETVIQNQLFNFQLDQFQSYRINFSMKKFRTEYFPDFFFAKLNFVPTAHPMSTGDQPLIEVPQKIYPSANGSSVIFGVWFTTKNLV